MARYMALWEVDTRRTPEDLKARQAQHLGFQEVVMKQLKDGVIKEWGAFAGEREGYAVIEGSAVQLHTLSGRWAPFVKFKVRELLTIDEVNKATKALSD